MPDSSRPLVLVTGASRGIGRATALAFAREGCRLLLAARSREALESVALEASAFGAYARAVEADVAADRGARALAAAVGSDALGVLVNNAGLFRTAPFAETRPDSDWQELLDVNLTGTFLTTLRCLPALLRAESPVVVNVLSVAALQGFPGNAGYAASKWGARGLTEVLRAEFAGRIRVVAVYPGATDTDAWRHSPIPHDRSRMLRPETVAGAIVRASRDREGPLDVVLETPPGAVG